MSGCEIRPTNAIEHCEGGWLYFIRAVSGGPIKVGRAKNLRLRLRMLQSGNPERLRILMATPDAGHLEKEVHNLLRPYKRGRTEWFEAEPTLAFIDRVIGESKDLAA